MWLYFLCAILFYDYISSDLTWLVETFHYCIFYNTQHITTLVGPRRKYPMGWRCFSNRCRGYIVTWRIFRQKWWREWQWRWRRLLSQKYWFILKYSMKLDSLILYITEQNERETLQYFVISELSNWLCYVFKFFSSMISIKSNHFSIISYHTLHPNPPFR